MNLTVTICVHGWFTTGALGYDISIAVFMAEPPQVLMDKGEGFSTCAIFNQYK